jgi:hypothetical protein
MYRFHKTQQWVKIFIVFKIHRPGAWLSTIMECAACPRAVILKHLPPSLLGEVHFFPTLLALRLVIAVGLVLRLELEPRRGRA